MVRLARGNVTIVSFSHSPEKVFVHYLAKRLWPLAVAVRQKSKCYNRQAAGVQAEVQPLIKIPATFVLFRFLRLLPAAKNIITFNLGYIHNHVPLNAATLIYNACMSRGFRTR